MLQRGQNRYLQLVRPAMAADWVQLRVLYLEVAIHDLQAWG